VGVEVTILRPVNQNLKLVAVIAPLVVPLSHLCHSNEIAAQSLLNHKGHPVAMHAPPITQREVVIALPFGLLSHQQALYGSVDRTKVGQLGHPEVTTVQVATARRLPS
jgi:hypothetical protein